MVPKMAKPWTKEEAKPFWEAVRKKAGANEEEMKTLDPKLLWEAWYEESRKNGSLKALQPSIDGIIIPKMPQEVAKEASYLDVPMIMGVTSQDFMPYIIFEMTYSWAKLHVKQGKSPVYGYLFDRELPGKSFKAFHASDLWYLFGNMDRSWRPFGQKDYDLKDQMIDYVANFVKTLDPNGEGLPEWPAISRKNKRFRHFDGTDQGLISPMACRWKELYSFLFDHGPM